MFSKWKVFLVIFVSVLGAALANQVKSTKILPDLASLPETPKSPYYIHEQKERILNTIMSEKYKKEVRPTGGNSSNGETQVEVNLALHAVNRIDDFNMEFGGRLTLRMEWYDDNLKFSHLDPTHCIKYLTLSDMEKIWMPDIYFVNEKQGYYHNFVKPNVYIRIFPDGKISSSIRMSVAFDCPMDLRLFPMDTQNCAIIMSSYARTSDDVEFRWRVKDPVELPKISWLKFSLKGNQTSSCEERTAEEIYSCIRVDFTLVRNFSYYATSCYIPCILLVIVSWVSFWIDPSAAPARVALCISTLLTMAAQQGTMNKTLPPVSYTKALDVWSGACLFFNFAALVEYALVNYAGRFDKRGKKDKLAVACDLEAVSGWKSWRNSSTSERIDLAARILFPVAFLMFNFLYWVVYLNASLNL